MLRVADTDLIAEQCLRGGVMYGAAYGPGGEASDFRYTLFRQWEKTAGGLFEQENERMSQFALFVMCNPSKATHKIDDLTVAKTMRLTRAWGFGRDEVRNAYPYRSTNPNDLKVYYASGRDPRGDNDVNNALIYQAAVDPRCGVIVAAWGNNAQFLKRSAELKELLASTRKPVYAFRVSNKDEPEHPLYQLENVTPESGMIRWLN